VTVANIESDGGAGQPSLAFDHAGSALDAVLDEVRERFGPEAATRATLLTLEPAPGHLAVPDEGAEGTSRAPSRGGVTDSEE
jgi:hypothetical protein